MNRLKEKKDYEQIPYITKEDKISLDDLIDTLGFGKFQLFILVVSGILWLSDGIEIMLLSILGPVLKCEWELESWQEALISTAVFAGIILGAPFCGWFADVHGRKKVLYSILMFLRITAVTGKTNTFLLTAK